MNWNRCFRSLTTALTLLVVVSLLAVPVAAISASADGVPDRQQVGQERQATFTLTDLYEDSSEEFTLRGETELEAANWRVRYVQLNGDTTSETFSGASFETTVSSADNVERVEIRVTGAAPEVANFTYDPAQRFELATFSKVVGENVNTVDTWNVVHYTEASAEARDAIDSASTAVEGANSEQAEEQLNRAIRAYGSGEFDLATDLAADAESTAQQSQQSSQTTELVLYGAIGVVALVAVAGAVFYLRGRSGPSDPLG
jgi:Spy/CpxP family protein refolding chaperone